MDVVDEYQNLFSQLHCSILRECLSCVKKSFSKSCNFTPSIHQMEHEYSVQVTETALLLSHFLGTPALPATWWLTTMQAEAGENKFEWSQTTSNHWNLLKKDYFMMPKTLNFEFTKVSKLKIQLVVLWICFVVHATPQHCAVIFAKQPSFGFFNFGPFLFHTDPWYFQGLWKIPIQSYTAI